MIKFPQKPSHKRAVYLDHAASTPLDPEVFAAMKPWLAGHYANPSALYASGVEARKEVELSRKSVADLLYTNSDSIIFTGSGTESINMAILGTALKHAKAGKHIITTKIEHKAVLETLVQLEKEGFEVTHLAVDAEGRIYMEELRRALRYDTILVSIMYVNNEIGTINPIADIGRELLKWRKAGCTPYPIFHSDACQAASTEDLNVEKLHVDLMSLNGSKIYGPKGLGILYKRREVALEPISFGGGQEFWLRSGTENVSGIIGIAKALVLTESAKERYVQSVAEIRDYFWELIQKHIPAVKLNGPDIMHENKRAKSARSVSNLNVSFAGVDADALVLYLDEYGVMCSKGSACETESGDSYVLKAIGLRKDEIKGTVRFTLGKSTSKKDIDHVMKYLPRIVEALRQNPVV